MVPRPAAAPPSPEPGTSPSADSPQSPGRKTKEDLQEDLTGLQGMETEEVFSRTASLAALADLKRRARCWFILARGATPSACMEASLSKRIGDEAAHEEEEEEKEVMDEPTAR